MSIFRILHENLGTNKISARWIPRVISFAHQLCTTNLVKEFYSPISRQICEENVILKSHDKVKRILFFILSRILK